MRVQMTNPLTPFQLNICSRQWVLGLCFAFKQKALTEWKNPWLPLNSTALEPLDWTQLNKTSEQVQSFKTVWNENADFHTKRFSVLSSIRSHALWRPRRKEHLISLVELHPPEPIITIISWGQKYVFSQTINLGCLRLCCCINTFIYQG